MAKTSLWVDPIYESMDDLSKIILPYYIDGIDVILELFSKPITITPQEIVRANSEYGDARKRTARYKIQDEINRLINNTESFNIKESHLNILLNYITDTNCFDTSLPQSIEYEYNEQGTVDIVSGDNGTLNLNLSINKDTVNYFISKKERSLQAVLTVKSCKGMLSKFRTLYDIFSSSPMNKRGVRQATDKVYSAILSSFTKHDIRSNVIFDQMINHVHNYISNDNLASLAWLKALKARMSLGETIYSMELK